MAAGPIELMPRPFESSIFGWPVAELVVRAPDVGNLAGALRESAGAGARLVSCRIPSSWTMVASALQAASFRQVETLVTFERKVSAFPDTVGIEPARTDDQGACVAIAGRAFRFDRFHADARLPARAADELKMRWVQNDLNGRADLNLIARDGNECAGFNLCMIRGHVAIIDLIAVEPGRQGRGVGRALIKGALHYLSERVEWLRAGTQANNTASVALYRALQFEPIGEQTTWHLVS